MALLLACEDLIPQVVELDPSAEKVTKGDSDRWQRLFSFSASEAGEQIREWRGTFGRYTIADDIWDLIRPDLSFSGYEYAVALRQFYGSAAFQPQMHRNYEDSTALSSSYILRLEGPIPDAETVKDVAGLQSLPEVLHGLRNAGAFSYDGEDDDNPIDMAKEADTKAQFCLVDGWTRLRILQQISQLHPTFRPTFIRDAKARKDLAEHSPCPTLGVDPRLPHCRPASVHCTFHPVKGEYPVWYFFYGTLADGPVLSRIIGLPPEQSPHYRSASVRGGRLITWAATYKALVDGSCREAVLGLAYLVKNGEDEDALRYYETDRYEVVRCPIRFKHGEMVMGLTFKFSS